MADPIAAVGAPAARSARPTGADARMVKEVDSKAPKGGGTDAATVKEVDSNTLQSRRFGNPVLGGEIYIEIEPDEEPRPPKGGGTDAPTVNEVDSKARKGGGAGDVMVKEVDSKAPKPPTPPEAAGIMRDLQSQVANNPAAALAGATANLNPATATRLI